MECKCCMFVVALTLFCTQEIFAETTDKVCDFPNIENGRIAQYYYSFRKHYFPMSKGKKLVLSCLAGTTTEAGNQEGEIVCTESGWSPTPKCYKKCTVPLLAAGFFYNPKESYKVMERVQYKCTDGYLTRKGTAEEEVQCFPEGWSSQPSCTKKSETCEAAELYHGRYSTTQTVFKLYEKLHYECDKGYYTTRGSTVEEVQCLPHGWSSLPQCIKLTCSSLQNVEHGGFRPVKTTYEDGDVVQFFCKENYSLTGSELLQCYYFGWSPEPPICEDRTNKCPPPPQLPHANLPPSERTYHNGDTAHIECEHNYEIKGSDKIQCDNGKWISLPSCIEIKEKVNCGQPPHTENGEALIESEIYYSGDRVQYRCHPGYNITGSKEIICKMGKWPSPPHCAGSNENCRPPPALENGDILDPLLTSYKPGSSAEYRCHSYHLMEGSKTAVCVEGKWSSQPTCLEPCNVDVNAMTVNNIKLKWSFEENLSFLHGDTIEFVCKENYDLPSPTAMTELMVQCNRGRLKYPKCIKNGGKLKCGSPPTINNGGIESQSVNYETGSSVTYRCSNYHFMQGSSRIHCMNGQWTSPPTCIEPCILSREEMEYNNIEPRWLYDNRHYLYHGDYVEFRCKVGYNAMSELRPQCNLGQLKYPKCV
ncbi:coagulation factor XIII B chain isoform X1 [Microcaecilia unicolor]|uniref:Beta-2-glycoprotein 1 n=1 Tax=Microcaecilia unicolor TaxID=1415580 RepID=A0A6P7YDX6_9AMPH|nr:coagulation factor XIII B chain isoform X1 [Microcaecilia unicolor]